MIAGHELNERIAIEIMGHKPTPAPKKIKGRLVHSDPACQPCSHMSSQGHFWGFKPYSEDMSAAWEVAQKFKMTVGWDSQGCFAHAVGNLWHQHFDGHADTAPLAVCLAALKANEKR